ncbi:flagellin [Ponticoccus alexandrii]|uniref:Flagellin n=1 Tax=Ponticoccus alexandrii TaxID=1943633 RepID=A0ABX7F901_9RHOB|nr:flagellin [Ponticoccus alexandrii]ETA51650.1 flagellin [Rhodobacteraceae bacterium PD-2]QRF66611.1 flagellin [Ponticoccus alexandrii]
MSSILTNPGAEAALATLYAINSNMVDVQRQLATGKKVHGAEDNAAVWAISKVMEADITGFQQVSESLALGQSTLAVARQGAESITELLTEVKGKVVAAQEENVDRAKIQDHIRALTDQIDAIVVAAQFNGQNLLQNTDTEVDSGKIAIKSSVNRIGSEVTTSDIDVQRRDMSTEAATITASGGSFSGDEIANTLSAPGSATFDLSGYAVEAGAAFAISVFGDDDDNSTFTEADLQTTSGTNMSRAEFASQDISYVAHEGDTIGDVVAALGRKWDALAAGNGIEADTLSLRFGARGFTASSAAAGGGDTIKVAFHTLDADAGNTIGGGLDMLGQMDVSTAEGAARAMGQIEGLLQYAIGVSAEMGSSQNRLTTQSKFIDGLSDSMRSGLGSLVDADLEEASARLQALQVQQQLATQALSIANATPQVLLGLFR